MIGCLDQSSNSRLQAVHLGLQLAVLFDRKEVEDETLEQFLLEARATLRPTDRVTLIGYADAPTVLAAPGSDFEKAVAAIRPGGTSELLGGLRAASTPIPPLGVDIDAEGPAVEALLRARMPFGRYAGCPLLKLPEPYLVWFSNQGFPEGLLGQQMALALEIKIK